MGNRIFVAVVVLLWASTTSWLMVARILPRILPSYFQGEPPAHGDVKGAEPVCWRIEYGDGPVGYAVSQAVPGAMGTTEIHSRVLLEGIEMRQMAPQWMGTLVSALGDIRLDSRTRIVLDSLGNLASFDTKVKLNDLPALVRMRGRVEGAALNLRLQTGDVTHESLYPVPSNAILTSELIPEPKLLQVYVGRKWQQEVFSPFRPPNSPLELLQAEVVEEGAILHEGTMLKGRKIEYRSLSTAGVAANNNLRAVVWVAEDGEVLRQDVYLMNAKLRFERCTDPSMLKMAEELLELDIVATLATPHQSP